VNTAPPVTGVPVDVVDLSLLLAEELPCWWSTHMPFQQKTFTYFDDRGTSANRLVNRLGTYQTRWLVMDEHTGTHVDAPAHFIPELDTGLDGAAEIGSVTTEQLPLSQLMGPAVVLDVPDSLPGGGPGISPVIPPQLVDDFEGARTARSCPGTSSCCAPAGTSTICREPPGRRTASIRSSPRAPLGGQRRNRR